MIEISRAHGFRPSKPALGLDLKSAWASIAPTVEKGVTAILTPSPTTGPISANPPAGSPLKAPASSSGTILGMPSGLVLVAGALAVGAGILVFVMGRD
jgi:hypothetical protein